MTTSVLSPRLPRDDVPSNNPPPRSRFRKRLLVLVALPVVGVVAVLMVVASMVGGGFGPSGGFGALLYDPNSSAPITVTDPRIADLSQEQLHNSVKIIAAAMAMSGTRAGNRLVSVPPRAWIIALATASQESDLINLDHGDRDSLGLFQQRPSQGWGTPQQIMNPTYSTQKFLDRLLQVPSWQTLPLTVAAQAVQRSGFPNAYAKWEPRATALVEALVQALPSAGRITNATVRAAIDFARTQLGKPYVWGATGPDAYDCSGLMLRAWEAAGVVLPRTSREQWHAGQYLPVREAQAGDLIFYAYDTGDPTTIHHVAMYLGDGTIIEAQQSGVPVHIRPFSFDEGELMSYAVRVTPTH
ncbi:MAG TPA: C40 family peptidase [Mycobacteriales bacterium]|nr:C40 family peptidase [Mycobacteriales bacterium]